MNIYRYSLGELQTNCYICDSDHKSVIIDPADDAAFILEELSRKNSIPQAVLLTHGHFDHVLAAGEIQMSFPIPVYLSFADVFLLKRVGQTAQHFLGKHVSMPVPVHATDLTAGELRLGGIGFQALSTPGHTPGSYSFFLPEAECVFTGDTLFRDAVGRTDLSYSSKPDLYTSLTRLYALPDQTTVYPGHGEETTIMDEKAHLVS